MTDSFIIRVDTAAIFESLTGLEQIQLPFAMSLGLNRVANIGQKAERDRLTAVFKLRRAPWILQGVYISKADRASKSTWNVTLRIQADRDFLNRMEEGGIKEPTKGNWLWKPNLDVFGDQVIMRSNPLHPSNIHFNDRMQAANRVFMVRSNGKRTGPLVLQRTSGSNKGVSQRINQGVKTVKGKPRVRQGGVRLLYTLINRTNVPRKLEFVDTITGAVIQAWPATFLEAMNEAMRTAR